MAIGNTTGIVVDLYREQIWNNPATYTAPVSDDFYQNAVTPTDPTQPAATRCPAYGAQQTTRSWQFQLKQRLTQV